MTNEEKIALIEDVQAKSRALDEQVEAALEANRQIDQGADEIIKRCKDSELKTAKHLLKLDILQAVERFCTMTDKKIEHLQLVGDQLVIREV